MTMIPYGMKEVDKETFYAAFADVEGTTHGCESTHKIWSVKKNGSTLARSIEGDDGVERYYIKDNAA